MAARRRLGGGLLCAGVLACAIAVTTEFVGVEWWSSVDLKKLRQFFVIVKSGQLAIGTRGTAGFFNRRIPAAGAAWIWPRDYSPEPWQRRLVPWMYDALQTRGVSIPLASPALVLTGAGVTLLIRRGRKPGKCRVCGYELAGLAKCPECGVEDEPKGISV